ncbi:hypothetical protein C8R46DRAFT_1228280 [Mycena filopes]|nr:hypothetical protein C8R46DRAFT_1228280 [Mycena filopes]
MPEDPPSPNSLAIATPRPPPHVATYEFTASLTLSEGIYDCEYSLSTARRIGGDGSTQAPSCSPCICSPRGLMAACVRHRIPSPPRVGIQNLDASLPQPTRLCVVVWPHRNFAASSKDIRQRASTVERQANWLDLGSRSFLASSAHMLRTQSSTGSRGSIDEDPRSSTAHVCLRLGIHHSRRAYSPRGVLEDDRELRCDRGHLTNRTSCLRPTYLDYPAFFTAPAASLQKEDLRSSTSYSFTCSGDGRA